MHRRPAAINHDSEQDDSVTRDVGGLGKAPEPWQGVENHEFKREKQENIVPYFLE